MREESNGNFLPLVLRQRNCISNSPCSVEDAYYDVNEDIWKSSTSKLPLVCIESLSRTSITDTREGLDQPVTIDLAGRTSNTFTREGIDQSEIIEQTELNNLWGRTIITRTSEGIDQIGEGIGTV
ncbi:hypothetical protein H1S01_19355 [Heliobacterium chlorum]|uniref:Uncharacterized protein n=1 Tax=Heliobacterium chlorum TaxID=2698 RepID=A0ABR7T763_HELCL|nr:hypothetical protein [Heliobacterium chlorum]MBC9786605.1 hypothetical protein [Heliobacterium chlorum]